MKLSQYRAAAGAGGDSGGEQEHEKIARALLSNTDKEVIFDGLKKLYRKKARHEFVCASEGGAFSKHAERTSYTIPQRWRTRSARSAAS